MRRRTRAASGIAAGWVQRETYEMERLRAGNVIEGPAVIEDPATTFVVPPGLSLSWIATGSST